MTDQYLSLLSKIWGGSLCFFSGGGKGERLCSQSISLKLLPSNTSGMFLLLPEAEENNLLTCLYTEMPKISGCAILGWILQAQSGYLLPVLFSIRQDPGQICRE